MKDAKKIGCMWGSLLGVIIATASTLMAFDLGRNWAEFVEILILSNAILWSITFIIGWIILKILDRMGF